MPADGTRQFGLRRLYVKDMSFEAPNSPGIFAESGLDPDIKVNLRTSQRSLAEGTAEVVLHVTVHAVAGERTVFLVELQQAGAFQISGFPPDETRTILGIACPNALFPYAREAVSSLIQRGGFAPILLQPIDFTALFAQAEASKTASAAPAGRA
ncbi:MAG: protein-export chaperone SecB [Gammaproteobacteria bacterium]|nr:protein-export chaperone SecB [Gammaproteobacteria bacterium]